jgi:hypothetical protein
MPVSLTIEQKRFFEIGSRERVVALGSSGAQKLEPKLLMRVAAPALLPASAARAGWTCGGG